MSGLPNEGLGIFRGCFNKFHGAIAASKAGGLNLNLCHKQCSFNGHIYSAVKVVLYCIN